MVAVTKYREKKYFCGDNFLEIDIFPIYEQIRGRRKKINVTTEVQKALNAHNRKKKLTRLLNANFTNEDIKIELTYSDENLPENDEDAEKQLRNFLRRLKRHRKKNEMSDLKYIVVTEKGKKTGRYHHHAVLSGGMMISEIRKLWGKGIIRVTPIESGKEGLGGLAEYLSKNITNGETEENKKAWHASKNLIQPKERSNDSKFSKRKVRELHENRESREIFENLYPDYELVDCRSIFNEVNGQYYLCVNMYRKEKPKSKPKRQKGKKKDVT